MLWVCVCLCVYLWIYRSTMLWFKERSTNITINWREDSRTLRLCLEQSVCLRVCLSVCVCVNENCKKLQKINEKSNKNRMSCGFLTPIKRLSWESPMIWYDIRVPKGTLCTEVRLTWQGLHKWVTFSIIYTDFQRILRLLRHGYGEREKGAEGRGHRADGQMERQLSCRGCVFRCTLQIATVEGVGVTTRAPVREREQQLQLWVCTY